MEDLQERQEKGQGGHSPWPPLPAPWPCAVDAAAEEREAAEAQAGCADDHLQLQLQACCAFDGDYEVDQSVRHGPGDGRHAPPPAWRGPGVGRRGSIFDEVGGGLCSGS